MLFLGSAVLGVVEAAGPVALFGHDDVGGWAVGVLARGLGRLCSWELPCWGLGRRGWPEGVGGGGGGGGSSVPYVGMSYGLSAELVVPLETACFDLLQEDAMGGADELPGEFVCV